MGVTTLTGSVWKWTHHERAQRAFMQIARQRGASVGRAQFGDPVGETSDEHLRVWLHLPGRWRFESEDRIELKRDSDRWIGSATHITRLDDDGTALEDTDLGMFIRPGSSFLGALRFGEPEPEDVAGRGCWRIGASLNVNRRFLSTMPLNARLGGIDHTFWFDAVTGIVLRHVGMVDDEPCTITEFKEFRVNPPLSDFDFEFVPPPGASVVEQVDHLVRMAELRGVDLTGVDRHDTRAVRSALDESMRSDRPPPEARLRVQRAKHVPVGDPPDDEAGAREAITYAYVHHDEVDASGEDLVNVQHGRHLALPLAEAKKRVPGGPGVTTELVVDDILFLRSDEAVVWFSLEVDGTRFPMVNGREGRAVNVVGRWLVERATIVDLLGMAGVDTSPPEE